MNATEGLPVAGCMSAGFARLRWLRLAVGVLCCLVAYLALTFTATASASGGSFIARSGAQLTMDGAMYRFVAFNDYQLTSMPGGYDCGRADTQADLNEVMRSAASAGATVIRTWFFQSYYDLNAQGHARSASWAAFDRVLNTAARYGLKVIPVLVNEYQQCEPASVTKNLGFFQSAYKRSGYGYPLSFKRYAMRVARHFADDTTVAFWQIGNELYDSAPSGCSAAVESQGAHALRGFADAMTGAIKSVDHNHLVSLGTQGSGQCGLAGGDYQYVMAGAVDLCEYHDYGASTQPIPNDGYNRLAQRIAQCRALNKPLFIGESGIPADVTADGGESGTITSASLRLRARFYHAKMDAAFNAGIVGYGLWDKEQDATSSAWNTKNDGDFEIGPNDPTNTAAARVADALRDRTARLVGIATGDVLQTGTQVG
jgi:mannan endo-1,4-beta-mannosidase